jgi:hypothetical protein
VLRHPGLCRAVPAPLTIHREIFFPGLFEPDLEILIPIAPPEMSPKLLPVGIPFTTTGAPKVVTVIPGLCRHRNLLSPKSSYPGVVFFVSACFWTVLVKNALLHLKKCDEGFTTLDGKETNDDKNTMRVDKIS